MSTLCQIPLTNGGGILLYLNGSKWIGQGAAGRKNSMGWTGWKRGTMKVFPGFRINIDVDEAHGWVHYLVTTLDEPEPDKNHIHIKASLETGKYVVAAVRVDGMRVINRRKLIEAINRETGLDLGYR